MALRVCSEALARQLTCTSGFLAGVAPATGITIPIRKTHPLVLRSVISEASSSIAIGSMWSGSTLSGTAP